VTAFVVGLACLFGPPSPVLHSGGDRVSAAHVCTDTFAPPPSADRALTVSRLGRVRVDMRADTESVRARLRGRAGELPVAAVGESKRRFVVRLPRHLGRQALLELDAGGDSFSVPLAPPPPDSPPRPVLRASGERLVMARGSFCWSAPPVGLCVDTLAPITTKALPVRRGGRVRMNMRLATDTLHATLRGRSGELNITRRSRTRFAVWLPRHMKRRPVLDLFATYPQGDGAFGARLRVRRPG
jgi:hypothetical protein